MSRLLNSALLNNMKMYYEVIDKHGKKRTYDDIDYLETYWYCDGRLEKDGCRYREAKRKGNGENYIVDIYSNYGNLKVEGITSSIQYICVFPNFLIIEFFSGTHSLVVNNKIYPLPGYFSQSTPFLKPLKPFDKDSPLVDKPSFMLIWGKFVIFYLFSEIRILKITNEPIPLFETKDLSNICCYCIEEDIIHITIQYNDSEKKSKTVSYYLSKGGEEYTLQPKKSNE